MAGEPEMNNERGFSLTELLIVIAILGFMMGGLFTLQRQGQLAYMVGAARVEVQQNGRIAIESMMTEIRSALAINAFPANCNTANGGTSITFNDQNGVAVTYSRTGASAPYTLDRSVGGVATTVIGGVQSLRIWCYNTSDALTANLADIRSIRVQVTTRTERGAVANSPGDQRAIAEGRVRLRNI
jgi:prepilin-type N-terminal cleavage/methylation domain-containing protein